MHWSYLFILFNLSPVMQSLL